MGLDSINLTLTQCVWHFPQSWGLALLSDNAISFQIFPLLKKKKKKKPDSLFRVEAENFTQPCETVGGGLAKPRLHTK